MKFAEYKSLDLAELNRTILEKWNKEECFTKTLKAREGAPLFIFHEGPPSANGMPGIHHVMARAIKDVFCRFKTQQGYLVKRKAGWDTHGLPVELGVEKMLGITKEDIGTKITVDEYNAACRKEVMKYTREWESLTEQMGYWVDMNDPYITYDNRYIETLWYLLKEIYKKGLLYKGYSIQPFSPAAGTGLSTHELNQPGCYRDVKDTTCVAQFEVIKDDKSSLLFSEVEKQTGKALPLFILAWTTTPWTLPSNTALCVGPSITYKMVRSFNPYSGAETIYILASELISQHFNPKGAEIALSDYKHGDKVVPYEVFGEFSGEELCGVAYKQLIPWVNPGEGAFRVIKETLLQHPMERVLFILLLLLEQMTRKLQNKTVSRPLWLKTEMALCRHLLTELVNSTDWRTSIPLLLPQMLTVNFMRSTPDAMLKTHTTLHLLRVTLRSMSIWL